jgi:hypothetical protein
MSGSSSRRPSLRPRSKSPARKPEHERKFSPHLERHV